MIVGSIRLGKGGLLGVEFAGTSGGTDSPEVLVILC
jgi:hypothetical protein